MVSERYFWQKVVLCACFIGWTLYAYIDKVNQVTEARIRLPYLQKECKKLQEENRRRAFVIKQFEDPKQLLLLAKQPEFGHLRAPSTAEILIVQQQEQQ